VSPRKRSTRRKLTDEDIKVLTNDFNALIEKVYMPELMRTVDDRIKQVLTHFAEQAMQAKQEANE
tara:strand:+ start:11815 stop:12009 length:195 start_codon:yes stop_codon:yes gene_type:complete